MLGAEKAIKDAMIRALSSQNGAFVRQNDFPPLDSTLRPWCATNVIMLAEVLNL
jgi:hypothetical protein